MTGSIGQSTEHWYSGCTASDDEENTHCQEDHADDHDQDKHEAERTPACPPLIFVRSGELFRSAGGIDRY